MERVRVLLIEDNAEDIQLVQEMLESSSVVRFEIESITSFTQGMQRIKEGGMDVVVLDLGFTESKGLETYRKAKDVLPGIPIVVLTALSDETIGNKAVQEGAQDYLIKGQITGPLLIRSICYAVGRKQSERRILQNQIEKQTILDTVTALIFHKDKENRILSVNKAFVESMGLSKTAIEGKNCFELWPEQAEDYWRDDKEVIASGQPKKNIIEAFKTVKGERWLQVDKIPYRDEQGHILGIIGFAVDITERRKIDEALNGKTAFLESLVEAALDGVLVVDNQGKRILTNQRLLDIWKVPKAIVEDESDEALLQFVMGKVSDPESFLAKVRYLYAHPDECSRDEIEFKDGTIFDRYSSPVIDRGRKYYGRIWTFRDMTDRKRHEAAVQKERDQAQQYLDVAGVMIVALNTEGQVTQINKKGCEMLGYSEGEIQGRNWFELCLPQEARPEVRDVFKKIISGDLSLSRYHENPVLTKGGQQRVLAFQNAILRDSSSRIMGVLFSGEDITERKRIEDQLRESEQLYRSVVDNIGIGVSLIGPGMEILSLNAQMRKWFPGIDVLKKPICYKAFNNPPRAERCSYCPSCKTLQDGLVHESVTETPTGGEIVNYRIVSSPVKGKDGVVTSVIEMVEDITERSKAEKQLKEKLEDLKNFQAATIDRENMMIELKKEINKLSVELGNPEPYDLSFLSE